MTSKLKLLVASTATIAAVLGASPGFAADLGTDAGTDITNNVSVSFEVGGVAQTAATGSDTFTVDRKINLTVSETDGTATVVSPNGQNQVLAFDVTNTTNDTIDILLSTAQQSGGTSAHGDTDNFDASNVQIFVDSNGNGTYDPTLDTATVIENLGEDETVRVFVVGDIPVSQVDGDVAAVELIAQAADANTGTAFTETTGANTSGVDNVFADADGDGQDSDFDDYMVTAAAVTVTKTSTVISDPINSTTNPKAIPGATIEYCIAVSNAAGGAAAENVAISDTIPANVTYVSAFGVKTEGTVTGTTCNADTTGTGSESGGVVSGNLGTIAAGATETLLFRVTVD